MTSCINLHESVQDAHTHLDSDRWDDIYVVGDVHGCASALRRLCNTLSIGANDLVVFVGDLIRKGPDSREVLEFVRDHRNMYSVRGNNEQKLIGGETALSDLDRTHLEYLESLPAIISWDDVVVVHGGIDHRDPLSEHTLEELLTMRSLSPEGGYTRPFWFERRRSGPQVFFGHTVLSEPIETEWAVGLDTGCVYGGQLTTYDYCDSEFVSVAPDTTYKERSPDSIVTPQAKPISK